MQESSQAGGASGDRRAAPQARLFATFKLAAPYVEIVQKRAVAGDRKPAANLNRLSLVFTGPSSTGMAPTGLAPVRPDHP
jgi:hypothetical protein